MRVMHGLDFYDYAGEAASDEEVVFERDGVVNGDIGPNNFPFTPRNRAYSHYEGGAISLAYTLFAGAVYPLMRVIHYDDSVSVFDRSPDGPPSNLNLCALSEADRNKYQANFYYDWSEANEVMLDLFDAEVELGASKMRLIEWKQAIEAHFNEMNPEWSDWLHRHKIVTGYIQAANFQRFDLKYLSITDLTQEQFDKAFILHLNKPCLFDIGFMQVKDPASAHEEIQGYIRALG